MSPLGRWDRNGVDNKNHSEVKVKLDVDRACLCVNESAGVGIWVKGAIAENRTCQSSFVQPLKLNASLRLGRAIQGNLH